MATYEPPNHDSTASTAYSTSNADNDHGRRFSRLDPHPAQSREHSAARSEASMSERIRIQPQPINEAVGSAFQSDVPPELIAQITENVLKQLKTSGIDGATPVPPTQAAHRPPPPPPAPPVHQPVPQSPSTLSGSSPPIPNRVFTPPSPHKHSDYPHHASPQSQSGFLPGTAHSPQEPRSPVRETPQSNIYDRRTSSPLSQSSESGQTRPKGPARLSTASQVTTLEKIWGQLFDEEGHPTSRLGQFLRGLAVHIIDDYKPYHSIVITPGKMVQFYQDVKLPKELYPWSTVFDDERSSISRMYRDLECQHHLVQEHFHERPDIPGLTPIGFQRWVTLLIQAHPEEEFERLAKAVLAMPINNPDEKKERFPKELSRRLFPSSGDDKVRERIETAISLHADVELPKRSSKRESSVPPSHKPSVNESTALPSMASRKDLNVNEENTPPPFVPSNIERERKPYSSIPESAIDDLNPKGGVPSKPIERERQPYSAQPGLGKQYEDDLKAREVNKPRSDSTATRHGRSDSNASRAWPIPLTGQPQPGLARPADMPKPEIYQHHRAPSNARRGRSPSFSADGRRSDGDLRQYPSTFQAGSVPTAESFDEEARRYARDRAERARRQADEDARLYGESPNNRARHDRGIDSNGPIPHRGSYLSNNEEDYYRANGRPNGSGYDYQQPYGGPVYR
ncbi:MAG: hypothetical protein LQ346_004175 [Caloplaca aetnensis]|nr:MAG: hypothetical protein LQ346_004175 [Caloplaca aetnensis]